MNRDGNSHFVIYALIGTGMTGNGADGEPHFLSLMESMGNGEAGVAQVTLIHPLSLLYIRCRDVRGSRQAGGTPLDELAYYHRTVVYR